MSRHFQLGSGSGTGGGWGVASTETIHDGGTDYTYFIGPYKSFGQAGAHSVLSGLPVYWSSL